ARATPEAFRFTVKAQRGGIRALLSDPEPTLAWLLGSLRAFGPRLGSVLYRVPVEIERADAGLDRLLAAWPADLPLTFEFQHTSWEADAVHERLARAGAALCATDLDEMPEPTLRLTGRVLYLRLRRAGYAPDELASWAARIAPFLAAGNDVFAFFRHDADGTSALRAIDLAERVAALRAAATAGSVSGAAAG
ncbi:MAG TPA: DUF72 domain-containing protein, partial [Candidatus Limnocylindrales bacterium]